MFNGLKKELLHEATKVLKQQVSGSSGHGTNNQYGQASYGHGQQGGHGQQQGYNSGYPQQNSYGQPAPYAGAPPAAPYAPGPHSGAPSPYAGAPVADPYASGHHSAAPSPYAGTPTSYGAAPSPYAPQDHNQHMPSAYPPSSHPSNGYSMPGSHPTGTPTGGFPTPGATGAYPNVTPGATGAYPTGPGTVGYGMQPYHGGLGGSGGKRRSLLIGINYFRQKSELRGCINDVRAVNDWLFRYYPQFNPQNGGETLVLTDDQQDPSKIPTRANITNAMRWLVSNAQPGDSFFLHFSGHGGTQKDTDGDEADGYDETICPLDYTQNGMMTDDELHVLLLRDLPQGCRFTAVFDSCHSGSVMDLPYTYAVDGNLQIQEIDNRKLAAQHAMNAAFSFVQGKKKAAISEMTNAAKFMLSGQGNPQAAQKQKATRTTRAFVSMFSGCMDHQTSADTSIAGKHTGAMSWALQQVVTAHQGQPIPYVQVLRELRQHLKGRYSQTPQMSTGFHTDMNQPFVLY